MMLLVMPWLDLCALCVYFHAIWLYPCLHMHICLDSCSSKFMCYASTCLHARFYAYMPRSMFSHACVLGSMFSTCFMSSSICLCALSHVHHAMCYCSPFVALSRLNTKTHIKGFGSSLFACLCLLTSMLYACVSLSCSRLYHLWCL